MTFNPTVIHRLDRWAASLRDLAPVLRGETASVTIDDIRRSYVRTMAEHPTPADMRIEQIDMGGVPATLVTPPEVAGDRVLFYIHGGAYIVGGPGGYHGLAAAFARALKARVYLPDYRLAPEHPFPVPIADTFAAYRWLIAQGQAGLQALLDRRATGQGRGAVGEPDDAARRRKVPADARGAFVLRLGPQPGLGADEPQARHVGVELGPGGLQIDDLVADIGRADEGPLHDVIAEAEHASDDQGAGSHQNCRYWPSRDVAPSSTAWTPDTASAAPSSSRLA